MASAKRGDRKGPAKQVAYCTECAKDGRQVEWSVIQLAGWAKQKGFFWQCPEHPEHLERSK